MARCNSVAVKATPDPNHPLWQLHEQPLGLYWLALTELKPVRLSGWRRFTLHLQDGQGRLSQEPVVQGIYSVGGRGVKPWIDMGYRVRLAFPEGGEDVNLAADGLDRTLIASLSTLIPPGGHIMVEYETPDHRETYKSLSLRVPPVVTPLGFLLYECGFTGGFKPWYFAEGGQEGPIKLQANKSMSEKHAREHTRRYKEELEAFLDCAQAEPLVEQAKERARRLLLRLAERSSEVR